MAHQCRSAYPFASHTLSILACHTERQSTNQEFSLDEPAAFVDRTTHGLLKLLELLQPDDPKGTILPLLRPGGRHWPHFDAICRVLDDISEQLSPNLWNVRQGVRLCWIVALVSP